MTGSALTLYNGRAAVINTAGVETAAVRDVLAADPSMKALVDTLGSWVTRVEQPHPQRRIGGMLQRDRWLSPKSPLEKMRMGRQALTDDVVGTAADGTEALVFSKTDVYCVDVNEEDIWNQIMGDLNLDDQLRKCWRDLFSYSNLAGAVWYDQRTYTVRGKRDKAKARKSYDLIVPVAMTLLDPTKIIPVGNLMFGKEILAYHASPMEAMRIDMILANRDGEPQPQLPRSVRINGRLHAIPSHAQDTVELEDPIVEQMIVQRYYPDFFESQQLVNDGCPIQNLFILNPSVVFRHTLTRPDYERFSDVRMESIFELLDLKAQLRQLDRTTMLGGIHYIILITKGTDKIPAEQAEINALKAQAFTISSVPVIVGDHRLNVEIISPKQDHTLERVRYDTLDVRIFSRLWQTFLPTGVDRDDPQKMAKLIGNGLESRRQMLRRTLEREVIDRTRRLNASQLTSRAKLRFHPASISLDFDAAWASFLFDLRANNEISRDTILSQFDLNQAEEAAMREREKERYDDIFQTQVAFSAPPKERSYVGGGGGGGGGDGGDGSAAATPELTGPGAGKAQARAAGRRLNSGSGAAPGSGQGEAPRNPRKVSNEPTPKEAARSDMLDTMTKPVLRNLARDLRIVGRANMDRDELAQAIRDDLTERGDNLEDWLEEDE